MLPVSANQRSPGQVIRAPGRVKAVAARRCDLAFGIDALLGVLRRLGSASNATSAA